MPAGPFVQPLAEVSSVLYDVAFATYKGSDDLRRHVHYYWCSFIGAQYPYIARQVFPTTLVSIELISASK